MRREFPKAVRVAALKRCTDEKGVPRCEACGLALKAGSFAFDHEQPDGMLGEPTLTNCQVLCAGPGSCHDRKTRLDTANIAEAKRREAKHLGADRPYAGKLRGQGFRPAGRQRRATAPLIRWMDQQ